MRVLLLHPVAEWSLARVAAVCDRAGWRLTIVTIDGSTVGDGLPALDEWIRVPALTDSPAELLAQIGSRKFDVVAAGNEFAVIAADVLARELGLRHNDVDRIRASRDKRRMRAAFQAYGVAQPAVVAQLSSPAESRAADWSGVRFPVIVKPVDMAMSLFVRKCDTRAEVEETLDRMASFKLSRLTNYVFTPGALVEEYVAGPEYSLEGVIRDGALVAHSLTRKFVSPLPACYEIGHIAGVDVPEQHGQSLPDTCERIARSWGMPDGVLHVELKMTADRLAVIEAAARPAGGHVPEIVELQDGLSLEDAYLHARAGLPGPVPPRAPRRTWHGIRFHFAERTPVVRPDTIEVVRVVEDASGVVPGAEPYSVNRRTGYTVLRSASPADLESYIGTP